MSRVAGQWGRLPHDAFTMNLHRKSHLLGFVAAALASSAVALPARADIYDIEASFPPRTLGTGLILGGASRLEGPIGLTIGPDVSYTQMIGETGDDFWFAPIWTGATADALYDTATRNFRLNVGPQFGVGILGVDATYLVDLDHDGVAHGVAVRPMVTFAWVTLGVRVGHTWGSHEATFVGAHLRLKWLSMSRSQ